MNQPFKETTLCAGVFGRDSKRLANTATVLDYCATLFEFKRVLLVSHDPHPLGYRHEWIQSPLIEPRSNRDFLMPMIYHIVDGPVMFVHWDGFILNPELFEPAFLEYDWIGAPIWFDGFETVENSFCWQSRKMVEAARKVPGQDPVAPQHADIWYSKTMRPMLEAAGVRFAPHEVCERFSLEVEAGGRKSFGFHGEKNNPDAFKAGWEKINRWQR